MTDFQAWLNTALAAVGPLVILWRLGKTQVEAMHAAGKAEEAAGRAATAALIASDHAQQASFAIANVAENVMKIETSTNSMKDALIESTAKASHLAGRAEATAEAELAAKESNA